MNETISNTTCARCQHCGGWTNYADDPHHKARIDRLERLRSRNEQLVGALRELQRIGEEDTKRLDKLEALGTSGLWWHARESTMGRGFRLHQSRRTPGCATARDAIDSAPQPQEDKGDE